MALPLKSGADLYNQQAIRMRLHNLGADPTEVGMGLIYFNTNTDTQGSNHSLHPCVYNGTSFKALAYVDDVANNAEFKALQDDVKLLKGDVDTDTLINNLKDLEEFLKGYDESDKLQSLLDGKLDKSGGTIDSTSDFPLFINTTASNNRIRFRTNGADKALIGYATDVGTYIYNYASRKYLGIMDDGTPMFDGNTLLHSGNYSDYALPLRGGKVVGGSALESFGIKTTHSSGLPALGFYNGDTRIGVLRYMGDRNLYIYDGDFNQPLTLIHSGNIGSYNAGGLTAGTITDLNSITQGASSVAIYESRDAANAPQNDGTGNVIECTWYEGQWQTQIFATMGTAKLYTRGYNASKGTWSDWKTIAFTDSDITGYSAGLKHSNGTVGATVVSSGRVDFSGNISLALGRSILDPSGRSVFAIDGNNSPQIGLDTCGSYSTYINGKDVYLRYGSSRTTGLILNSSGNVTIGTSDLASTTNKLFVDGGVVIKGFESTQGELGKRISNSLLIGHENYGLQLWSASSGKVYGQVGYVNGTATAFGLILQHLGGNVIIGTVDDKGYKLNVVSNESKDYDFHVYNSVTKSSLFVGKEFWYGTKSTGVNETAFTVRTGVTGDGGGGVSRFSIMGDGTTIIDGNLHVKGNIVADKEVSAGGAGEEGGSSSGGSGAFDTTTLTKGQSSYNVAHNLGTDNVIICIYEKSTSGTWEMILTDVEITDANNIKVTFGSATSVDHKVVIMGAVA